MLNRNAAHAPARLLQAQLRTMPKGQSPCPLDRSMTADCVSCSSRRRATLAGNLGSTTGPCTHQQGMLKPTPPLRGCIA